MDSSWVGMKEVNLKECLSTHRKFFSSERDSRRLCSSRGAGIAEVHLGQAGKVQAYSRGFQAEHTSGINNRDGKAKRGKGPTKELPMGQDSSATLGLSPTGPMRECECQRHLPQALFTPILCWPTPHLWPEVGTGSTRGAQGPSAQQVQGSLT